MKYHTQRDRGGLRLTHHERREAQGTEGDQVGARARAESLPGHLDHGIIPCGPHVYGRDPGGHTAAPTGNGHRNAGDGTRAAQGPGGPGREAEVLVMGRMDQEVAGA
jgi:hypothetical protein